MTKKTDKDWRAFLPRGTKAQLAEKYGLSRMAVTRIIRDEDVINHSGLINEARRIALKTRQECMKHAKELQKVS